jgi:hypothetical protein
LAIVELWNFLVCGREPFEHQMNHTQCLFEKPV